MQYFFTSSLRETERELETDRASERGWQREKGRDWQTERETDRQTERERERERQRQRQRQRDRETETERQRHRETQRDRDREILISLSHLPAPCLQLGGGGGGRRRWGVARDVRWSDTATRTKRRDATSGIRSKEPCQRQAGSGPRHTHSPCRQLWQPAPNTI